MTFECRASQRRASKPAIAFWSARARACVCIINNITARCARFLYFLLAHCCGADGAAMPVDAGEYDMQMSQGLSSDQHRPAIAIRTKSFACVQLYSDLIHAEAVVEARSSHEHCNSLRHARTHACVLGTRLSWWERVFLDSVILMGCAPPLTTQPGHKQIQTEEEKKNDSNVDIFLILM